MNTPMDYSLFMHAVRHSGGSTKRGDDMLFTSTDSFFFFFFEELEPRNQLSVGILNALT